MHLEIVLCLAFVGFTNAQVPGRGKCPDIPVQQNFDSKQYLGTWYEYERFFAAFELGGICGHANYTAKPNQHIGVLNMGINKWTGKVTAAVGDAYAPNPEEPAKLVVSFSSTGGPFAKGNYWVLETDFTHFAVVWSCSEIDLKVVDLHGAIAWILTRKRGVLEEQKKTQVYDMFKQYGIDPSHFQSVDQTNCSI